MADTMATHPMSPPRPDESFVDDLIIRAGGRRLTNEERANDEEENADYILDDYVLEAKDIQEEPLSKQECHHKIAEIFWPYFEEAAVIPIDPEALSRADEIRYIEILARPIEKRIEKACRQVKATIARMSTVGWTGGLILLNSGYTSLPHDAFEHIAANAAAKSRYIGLVVCITTRAHTNGFDSYMNWEISPKKPRTNAMKRIFDAYGESVDRLMNDWARHGFLPSGKQQPFAKPVSFEYGGKLFVWDPGLQHCLLNKSETS